MEMYKSEYWKQKLSGRQEEIFVLVWVLKVMLFFPYTTYLYIIYPYCLLTEVNTYY